MILTSLSNPKIKNIILLQRKSRERKKQKRFVVEGIKEIQMALQSHFELEEIYFCSQILDEKHILDPLPEEKKNEITSAVFQQIGYRNTGGIIGIFKVKDPVLSDLKLRENPLIIVLEKIEKPGNLGAILRTADAANVDLVMLCDSVVDLYNPNVIRSGLGCLFSVPIINTTTTKAIKWLKEQQISIQITSLHKRTISLYKADFKGTSAIVMGAESTGLSTEWVEHADTIIKIPMHGKIDSLNVSNAAAICVFEALRQRESN